jgi:hypothetical protein
MKLLQLFQRKTGPEMLRPPVPVLLGTPAQCVRGLKLFRPIDKQWQLDGVLRIRAKEVKL